VGGHLDVADPQSVEQLQSIFTAGEVAERLEELDCKAITMRRLLATDSEEHSPVETQAHQLFLL
jgi:hypothetical protein